ncbi:10927_t:CDS:10 [Diversispora eburnea]|uniref:10927_t:CDS:1 n=1 Tax=Diversispora eburnea TaxID=1213867 RepID=A0A9N8V0I9_9GLOM|nr:10927_t:CDS:10 [Diversispora eburnea]
MISTKKQQHLELEYPIVKLSYEIHSYSSYTASFYPNNILEDKPSEQSSRWSIKINNQAYNQSQQFILIKLETMAIVQHVTNLKQFKVYGGLTANNMIELLHSGLRNNACSESFRLKHKVNHQVYRENEAIRLCLKHFRQRNYLDAFNALQSKAKMLLEDPLITNIYTQLVTNGDFEETENIMIEASEKGLFEEYIRSCSYKHLWKKIDVDGESPCMRGGHQMCIDVEAGHIYLLGGWDGNKNLSDFWVYVINNNKWKLISSDTREQGGPSPRSNHKMSLDPSTKQLYILGRFIGDIRGGHENFTSDFYRYNIKTNEWNLLCENTFSVGGPQLIYGHQMCIDSKAQMMYLFGGRTIHKVADHYNYSGLYTYNIKTNEWKLIRSNDKPSDNLLQFKSRIGHSMLFDQDEKLLYIIGGDRDYSFLSDFFIYDIHADMIHELTADYAILEEQEVIFTQRTTFDVDTQEFFVLSGLKDKRDKKSRIFKNSLWVYNLPKGKWNKIYQSDAFNVQYWESGNIMEPCPRYAHQMVYDDVHKVQYLFGGRTVETEVDKQQRLNDFWALHLVRPESDVILRNIKFQIRIQRIQLSQVVDHSNESESKKFQSLTSNLFHKAVPGEPIDLFNSRTELFEKLLEYFPEEMKQPKGNLLDLVKVE